MAKVTLVTRNFPPLTGGMERLVFQMYLGLGQYHQILLVGPKGCNKYIKEDKSLIESSISPTPLFLISSLFKTLYQHLINGKPDVIVGGSGLVGPVVVMLGKLVGAKTVLLLHGLDIIVESKIYQWFFIPFIRKADLIICNSQNTYRLAVNIGIPEKNISIVNPGVDLPENIPSQQESKKILGYQGKKILLSVGRLVPRKGIAEFITNAFIDIVNEDPNYIFIIVGSEPKNALNRGQGTVLKSIREAVQNKNLVNNVKILGSVDDSTLMQLYSAADEFIFPLKKTRGDVEGFGMVAIEAAAYGTPTVAFNCGGVQDAIQEGESGYLVEPGDYKEMTRTVFKAGREDLRQSSIEFSKRFSWEKYVQKINIKINELVNSN